MTAIDKVRQKLETSGLGGRVEKTYHKLLRGYWWFPDEGTSVYLGASKGVALVTIDAMKYGIKRQRERDMVRALAAACGATITNPRA